MVNTNRQSRFDYLWMIVIFFICSCNQHSQKTPNPSLKYFDNDQQPIYKIDERSTNEFLGRKLQFSGRAKRIDSLSSSNVLLEIIEDDNTFFIPIDHIYFTKPISAYFFSHFYLNDLLPRKKLTYLTRSSTILMTYTIVLPIKISIDFT